MGKDICYPMSLEQTTQDHERVIDSFASSKCTCFLQGKHLATAGDSHDDNDEDRMKNQKKYFKQQDQEDYKDDEIGKSRDVNVTRKKVRSCLPCVMCLALPFYWDFLRGDLFSVQFLCDTFCMVELQQYCSCTLLLRFPCLFLRLESKRLRLQ